jgi:hypothetical protein
MPLKDILRKLLNQAEKENGEVAIARLAKGMEIRMKVQDDLVIIQLSRNGVYPSMGEWKTILACWPEPVHIEQDAKKLIAVKDRYFLRGKLRREKVLLHE